MEVYDKKRIPMKVGDVLKVFHFTAALRRKKYYMYKQIIGIMELRSGGHNFVLSHLHLGQGTYGLSVNGAVMGDYEIVQSVKCDHEDRPRKPKEVV